MEKSFIKGYKVGDNITLLNVIYHRPKKDENGKYGNDSIDIVFKDMNSGEKHLQHIESPKYTYWITNEEVPVNYPRLFIEKNKCYPIECKYRDLKKSIAINTNNTDFFYNNLNSGNYKENDRLFTIPSVFNADMHIEDYYRWLFDRCYKNEPYDLHKLYFDIEVDAIDMVGDFPEMGECPINAITMIDEYNKNVYTLLLENYNNPLIDEFKINKNVTKELKDFIRDQIGGWKNEIRFGLSDFNYKIYFYDEEIKLITDFFNTINILKVDFAMAWNIAFDLPYLIARIYNLGYNVEEIICHPDFKVKECKYYIDKRAKMYEERTDMASISSYTVYIDQLITFASRRKGQRAVSSFKLDNIGNIICGVRKLDYSDITTNLVKLPYLNYKVFVFYNIMDVIVQYCIERRVEDIDFIFNKSLSTNTRYQKVNRQTTYLVNRAIKDFWDMGYIVGNNNNKNNEKVEFTGAYVADPTLVSNAPKLKINDRSINVCDNLNDFDYTALYPSIIDENNMAPNTQVGKVLLPEKIDKNENKYNNSGFDRSTWFIEDYNSGDRLNFCERYLGLASYEEMYNDVLEYFSTVKAPLERFRLYNVINGKPYMVGIVPNKENRIMASVVDNSKKRIMCIRKGKMPNE